MTLACCIVKKSSPMESDVYIALQLAKLIMNLTIMIIIVYNVAQMED